MQFAWPFSADKLIWWVGDTQPLSPTGIVSSLASSIWRVVAMITKTSAVENGELNNCHMPTSAGPPSIAASLVAKSQRNRPNYSNKHHTWILFRQAPHRPNATTAICIWILGHWFFASLTRFCHLKKLAVLFLGARCSRPLALRIFQWSQKPE